MLEAICLEPPHHAPSGCAKMASSDGRVVCKSCCVFVQQLQVLPHVGSAASSAGRTLPVARGGAGKASDTLRRVSAVVIWKH